MNFKTLIADFIGLKDLFRYTHRSAKLWAVSRCVDNLDVFLSHSWRSPGRKKFLALCLESGWAHATSVAIIWINLALLCVVLNF